MCLHIFNNNWIQFVSDIAIFVLKRDVKLQLTNWLNTVSKPWTIAIYGFITNVISADEIWFVSELFSIYH